MTTATISNRLLRALDHPVRESLEAARRPLLMTVAPAAMGLALIAVASLAASSLDGAVMHGWTLSVPCADALRAALEAMLVAVPPLVMVGTYIRLATPPAALVGAVSSGMLTAGVTAMAVLPLMGLIALVTRNGIEVSVAPGVIVPTVALLALAIVVGRVLRTIDPSGRARAVAAAFSILLFATYGLRISALLRSLW